MGMSSGGSSTPVAEPSMPSLASTSAQVPQATAGMLDAFNSMPFVGQNPANTFTAQATQNPQLMGALSSGLGSGGSGASTSGSAPSSSSSPISQAMQSSFNTSTTNGGPAAAGAGTTGSTPGGNPIAQAAAASGGASGSPGNYQPLQQESPMLQYWAQQAGADPTALLNADPAGIQGGMSQDDAETALEGSQAFANQETPAFQQAMAQQANYQPAQSQAAGMPNPAFMGATDPYNPNQMNPYSGAAASGAFNMGGTSSTDMTPFMLAMLQKQQTGSPTAASSAPLVQFM